MKKNSKKVYLNSVAVDSNSYSLVNKVPVFFIRLYQKFLSPLLGTHCRYHPSCSRYAVEAYKKHNFFKATFMMIWRIMRCNPWSKGGIDQP